MLTLINLIIKRAVDRIIEMLTDMNKEQEIIDEATTRLLDRVPERDLFRKVAERISASDIAEEFDVEEIAGHIDAESVAQNVDVYDIVNNIDMSDVAGHIDMDELADKVATRVKVEEVSPAPSADVSDPSLIERLLDKAVDKLLAAAEEAAKNGEV